MSEDPSFEVHFWLMLLINTINWFAWSA